MVLISSDSDQEVVNCGLQNESFVLQLRLRPDKAQPLDLLVICSDSDEEEMEPMIRRSPRTHKDESDGNYSDDSDFDFQLKLVSEDPRPVVFERPRRRCRDLMPMARKRPRRRCRERGGSFGISLAMRPAMVSRKSMMIQMGKKRK